MSELKKTISQAQRFILVSGVSFCIDATVYWTLASQTSLDSSWAKRISFASIALWGFFAHKYFTFGNRGFNANEPIRFVALYLTGWILNSFVHDAYVKHDEASSPAFVLATLVWASWNFLGQKFFVFRKDPSETQGEQA